MSTNDPDKHHRFGPPGDRYTGNEEILRIEAKLAAERPPQNAALPIDEDVERKVREWCEDNGLTPAWEVADD